MSEFMERHMAQRLIGAPPGYADSEQGGFLTEAVRRRPYSVLLFDEVEKAHADVFNLLLQVLDDGRLTDGRGRLADFSNTVVIMTSNIGSERILETDPKLFESEDGREALRDVLLEELKDFFRPEFLNRIDETLIFRPLTKLHLRQVVDIQLGHLERLLGDRRLKLELDDAAKTSWSTSATSPRSARARSSAASCATCKTRWRTRCSPGSSRTARPSACAWRRASSASRADSARYLWNARKPIAKANEADVQNNISTPMRPRRSRRRSCRPAPAFAADVARVFARGAARSRAQPNGQKAEGKTAPSHDPADERGNRFRRGGGASDACARPALP